MMNGFGGGMGFGMGFGWIFWLIIIGVAIWAVIRLTDNSTYNTVSKSTAFLQETPLNILKKRYARGEITESEYKQMRKNL